MILLIADTIIGLCLFALFLSIMINFIMGADRKVRTEKKSIVETGTMTLFFLGFYLLIRFRIGEIPITIPKIRYILLFPGLPMIVSGCVINISGRFNLGSNWSNQIKIYNNQTLVQKGWYGIVRHPLYASLMLMYYGSCLVYPNYLAFLANSFVFIPFMYFRAKQEEILLSQTFEDYEQYKKEVGMFFPKIIK